MTELPSPRPLVVIPVYNHGATLAQVVQSALQQFPEVLVVDDGSTDGGAQGVEALGARLVSHECNRGKGAAIRTAAAIARGERRTHLITVDADGQHDPGDLPRFLEAIAAHPEAIVVGVRDFRNARVPRASRFGRAFSNFWLRVQTGRTLRDTQSGFRAYPVDVLHGLSLGEAGYAFEVEVLVKAAWAGVELREVDVSVHYAPGDQRVSHFHLWRDNLRLTLLNTRLTLRSIVPWPHRKLEARRAGGERISVLHPVRSVKALLTENLTPGELAAAGALGVFLGALPLIACHTVTVLFAAGYLRLNKVAAVSASQVCMPPLMPALCIEVGYYLRHGEFLTEISWRTLGYQAPERLWEWLLGSLLVGPVAALAVAGFLYGLALFLRAGGRVLR